jgi:ABC-type polysaccharide/polyol phosphate transport system ATPase subunit
MPDPAITLKHVSKQYFLYQKRIHRILETFHPRNKQYHTPFHAVNDVSFEVQRGESVAIIGRNGSGKSTLLQLICKILQPTGGNVIVDGRISALLELGAGFNPEFTGRENVYLNTFIMGLSRAETDARFDQIADFAEIGDFIDRPVKTYSSGMYVRLAFATTISVEPDILIVDEALAVGDIFFQQKCVKHMKRMMESCTIVLVSHDMQAVSNLCERVIVMEKGRKMYDGQTAEGVACYIRLVHDGLFKEEETRVMGLTQVPKDLAGQRIKVEQDFLDWIPVTDAVRGGAAEATILRVSVTSNDQPFKTIKKDDPVLIRMLVKAERPFDQAIFGYTIRDRLGLALFGENSLSSLGKLFCLESGYSLIQFTLTWPEVLAQEYTLTLGMGEGDHPFHHVIQCWAHNIFSFSAVTPDRCVHGLFNTPLTSLCVDSL